MWAPGRIYSIFFGGFVVAAGCSFHRAALRYPDAVTSADAYLIG